MCILYIYIFSVAFDLDSLISVFVVLFRCYTINHHHHHHRHHHYHHRDGCLHYFGISLNPLNRKWFPKVENTTTSRMLSRQRAFSFHNVAVLKNKSYLNTYAFWVSERQSESDKICSVPTSVASKRAFWFSFFVTFHSSPRLCWMMIRKICFFFHISLTVCCLHLRTSQPHALVAYWTVCRWFDRNPLASNVAILFRIQLHKYPFR